MATTQEVDLYEATHFALQFLIATRTALVFQEEQKECPDLQKIAQWENEIDGFVDEQIRLCTYDTEKIQQTKNRLGAQIKTERASAQ
jgi:hypothetical protein